MNTSIYNLLKLIRNTRNGVQNEITSYIRGDTTTINKRKKSNKSRSKQKEVSNIR